MRRQDLELRIRAICERAVAGESTEDTLVELKANWPDDLYKAARRLAAHANCAHGDSILWIVGIDEKSRRIESCQAQADTWLSQLRSHFQGPTPELRCQLTVDTESGTVVGLLFDTYDAPYLVRNSAFGSKHGGPVELETPWREGTHVRSARREDLMRILLKRVDTPTCEVCRCTIRYGAGPMNTSRGQRSLDRNSLRLDVDVYVVTRVPGRLVFPFHRARGGIWMSCQTPSKMFDRVQLGPMQKIYDHGDQPVLPISTSLSTTIQGTPTELLVHGPGMVAVSAEYHGDDIPPLEELGSIELRSDLVLCSADREVELAFPHSFEATVSRGESFTSL